MTFPHAVKSLPATAELTDKTGDWLITSPPLEHDVSAYYYGSIPMLSASCVDFVCKGTPRFVTVRVSSYPREGAVRIRIGQVRGNRHLLWGLEEGKLGQSVNPMFAGMSEWLKTVPVIASLENGQCGYIWASLLPGAVE